MTASFTQLNHPDVAGPLAHVEDDLVPRYRDFEKPRANVHQRPPSLVGMIYGGRRSQRAFRSRLQALRPDATKAVPVGSEIKEVPVRRPSRLIVPTALG